MSTFELVDQRLSLYKKVNKLSTKWVVKARQAKTRKVVTVTLGKVGLIPKAEVRVLAQEAIVSLSKGENPNEKRKEEQRVAEKTRLAQNARRVTLAQVLEDYLTLKTLKPSTERDYRQTITRNFADWVDRPLRDISRNDVLKRFQEIPKRVQAERAERQSKSKVQGKDVIRFTNPNGIAEQDRAFRYLRAVINFVKNDIVGEKPLLTGNPVDVISDKKVRPSLTPRETHLSENQREELMELLSQARHPDYKGHLTQDDIDFIFLLSLTALRVDEARSILWNDINFVENMYEACDTKNKRNHKLPMTDATYGLFQRRYAQRKDGDTFVFSSVIDGTKPSSMSRTFQRLHKEFSHRFNAHDLRRTVATIASEMGYDLVRIGAVLNYKKRGVTARYIQTTKESIKKTLEDIEYEVLRKFDRNPAEENSHK